MYEIEVSNKKTKKKLNEYILLRQDIKEKLDKLREEPRKSNGAHQLHGKLAGKWSCWLGSNIRLIYVIDDKKKTIFLEAVGSHKIY